VAPDRDLLLAYRAALANGWGPHFLWHLEAIAADAEAFLASLSDWRSLTDSPPLHRFTRLFLKDGVFAGIAVLRWPPAGQDLPREAWGHLGRHGLPGLRARGL
jgi:hypothetical protein